MCGPREWVTRLGVELPKSTVETTDKRSTDMAEKIWFITGTSRGFGREWTIAALERGDKVAATARDIATLDDIAAKYGDALLPIALDVTDHDADFAAVKQAHDHFGRLDVVVNNAGYGQFGFIEELTEREARDQIETNVFGALWITQAALPYLREQRSGHIVQVSSIGGISAFANVGIYHASKWALEGFSQALSKEVESFGIHVTLVEPGGFATDWAGPSSKRAAELPAYAETHAEAQRVREQRNSAPGDPKASGAAILKVVDAEKPPLRVFFGTAPLGIAKADYEARLANWEEWQPVAELAQG
jgi:NAD(P)-dependent dehydrogenase (short-subunit alcohol dehydrogenase family)